MSGREIQSIVERFGDDHNDGDPHTPNGQDVADLLGAPHLMHRENLTVHWYWRCKDGAVMASFTDPSPMTDLGDVSLADFKSLRGWGHVADGGSGPGLDWEKLP